MPELLARLIDKGPGEDASKRGDVIVSHPDGWAWSVAERTNRDWIIIKVGILDVERDTLIAQDHVFPFGRFRRRAWFIDFLQLALPSRFNWPRTQESVTITRVGFIIAITQKPALV